MTKLRKRFWFWVALLLISFGEFGYYKWTKYNLPEILNSYTTRTEITSSFVHPVVVWPKLIDAYCAVAGNPAFAEIKKFLVYSMFGLLLIGILGVVCGATYSFIEIARWRRWGRFRNNPDLEI